MWGKSICAALEISLKFDFCSTRDLTALLYFLYMNFKELEKLAPAVVYIAEFFRP